MSLLYNQESIFSMGDIENNVIILAKSLVNILINFSFESFFEFKSIKCRFGSVHCVHVQKLYICERLSNSTFCTVQIEGSSI